MSAASCASSPRRRRPASEETCRSGPRWSSGSTPCLIRRVRPRVSTPCTATPTFRHATRAPTRTSPPWSRPSSNGSPRVSATRWLARAIRNPQQTEAENPSLVDGDLGGGSYELDQQLPVPPRPRAVPPSHAATGPVRRRGVGPSRRLGPGHGRPLRGPGADRRSPAAPVASLSTCRALPAVPVRS